MSTPVETAKPTSQTYSTRLRSLQPGTEYFYRVESRNRFETIITDEISFRTLDDSKKSILYTFPLLLLNYQ
jgi:phosphodiesterase/alkaline phosphatase D-like protein